jgi:hypothetical protein
VRFRVLSESEWHGGSTQNLSDSGAVIRARTELIPATFLEIVVAASRLWLAITTARLP